MCAARSDVWEGHQGEVKEVIEFGLEFIGAGLETREWADKDAGGMDGM